MAKTIKYTAFEKLLYKMLYANYQKGTNYWIDTCMQSSVILRDLGFPFLYGRLKYLDGSIKFLIVNNLFECVNHEFACNRIGKPFKCYVKPTNLNRTSL